MTEVTKRPKTDGAVDPADRLSDNERSPARDTSSAIVTVTARSRHLKSASMLVIAGGIVSLANGIVAIFAGGDVDVGITIPVGTYCGALVLSLGIGGILSGITAYMLRRISPALAGAVMGMAGGGIVGFWLGLAAIVLLTLSHEDF